MIKKTLCFTRPAYLSLHQCQLVIRLPEVEENDSLSNVLKEQAERTIPVEDIGVVVLDHRRITITSGALDALLQNNCAVITCNAQGHPAGLLLPLSGNTLQSERFREQIKSSLPLRKQLWQQTIKQKIINQAAVLRSVTGNYEKCMQLWAEQVRSGDPDNIEARAAAHYWQHIFPQVPHFVRAREGEPPNNLTMAMLFCVLWWQGHWLAVVCCPLWVFIITIATMPIAWPTTLWSLTGPM